MSNTEPDGPIADDLGAYILIIHFESGDDQVIFPITKAPLMQPITAPISPEAPDGGCETKDKQLHD